MNTPKSALHFLTAQATRPADTDNDENGNADFAETTDLRRFCIDQRDREI